MLEARAVPGTGLRDAGTWGSSVLASKHSTPRSSQRLRWQFAAETNIAIWRLFEEERDMISLYLNPW